MNTPVKSVANKFKQEQGTAMELSAHRIRQQSAILMDALNTISMHGERKPSLEASSSSGDETSNTSLSSLPSLGNQCPPGHLLNFGVVIPGVYRGSYPTADNFDFIRGLGLKSIVTLVQRDEDDVGYTAFMTRNKIQHHVFNMKGTKKAQIPVQTMQDILHLVLDQKKQPLLLHCNHGKHRTGCVVGVVRKVAGWELPAVLEEYRSYAEPKIRETDIEYITNFQIATLPNLQLLQAKHFRRNRGIIRSAMVAFFVLFLWICTAIGIYQPRREKTNKTELL